MVWMFVSSSSSYVETLYPNVMVLGGGTLGSHEGGALMNGIGTLIKEAPKSPLLWRHSKKLPSMNQEVGSQEAAW